MTIRLLSPHSPRTLHGPNRRRLLAGGLVAAMTMATAVLAAGPASAATTVSQSQGQFLSGAVLGGNLDNLLKVAPAKAVNDGSVPTVTDNQPLDATALNAAAISLGGGNNLLGNQGLLTLGAVNQFAQAKSDGSSRAASGAVDNTGGISTGTSAAPANASLNLTPLLGAPVANAALSNAGVTTGALASTASQAAGAGGAQSGTYQISSLQLQQTSPMLGNTTAGLTTAVNGRQSTVDGLTAAIRALPSVGPLATIAGLPNLTTITNSLTDVTGAGGGIVANLQTGVVTADVAKILQSQGRDIDNLPPNTALLPYITTAQDRTVTGGLNDLVQQVDTAFAGITVTLPGGVKVPITNPLVAPVLAQVQAGVLAPITAGAIDVTATVLTPMAKALTALVSLTANVQSTAGGTFTETALRVGVTPPTAAIDLASSAVGPNAGPAPSVTATAINPDHGPQAGGTSVTITGTGFVPGATSITIGGTAVPATAVTVNPAGTTATFKTPAHPIGRVGVTVTAADATTAPLTYTYDPGPAAKPIATAINLNHGPQAGGTSVTITGTGFVPGATSITIGGITVPATAVTVNPAGTTATFKTPAHPVGRVGVTVTTAGGTTTPLLTYIYDPAVAPSTNPSPSPTNNPVSAGLQPPVITSPSNGSTVGTATPAISGTGRPGSTAQVADGSRRLCVAPVDVNGYWVCTPAGPLDPGSHTITATQTHNGVTSGPSSPVTFQVSVNGSGSLTGTGNGAGSGSGAGNGTLANTGVSLTMPLTAALVMLLLGVGLLLGVRRRRSAH